MIAKYFSEENVESNCKDLKDILLSPGEYAVVSVDGAIKHILTQERVDVNNYMKRRGLFGDKSKCSLLLVDSRPSETVLLFDYVDKSGDTVGCRAVFEVSVERGDISSFFKFISVLSRTPKEETKGKYQRKVGRNDAPLVITYSQLLDSVADRIMPLARSRIPLATPWEDIDIVNLNNDIRKSLADLDSHWNERGVSARFITMEFLGSSRSDLKRGKSVIEDEGTSRSLDLERKRSEFMSARAMTELEMDEKAFSKNKRSFKKAYRAGAKEEAKSVLERKKIESESQLKSVEQEGEIERDVRSAEAEVMLADIRRDIRSKDVMNDAELDSYVNDIRSNRLIKNAEADSVISEIRLEVENRRAKSDLENKEIKDRLDMNRLSREMDIKTSAMERISNEGPMTNCLECGARMSNTARFCPLCGKSGAANVVDKF